MNRTFDLIEKLKNTRSLSVDEYEYLIENRNEESQELLKKYAVAKRQQVYSNHVFVRGLIEISNICKNDCFYCGIRKSNKNCEKSRKICNRGKACRGLP